MAVLGVYAKPKIKIFIWEQVLGTRRPFGHFGKPKISPGIKGPPQVITSFQSSGGIGLTKENKFSYLHIETRKSFAKGFNLFLA